jgi:cellobiose phosphorylase
MYGYFDQPMNEYVITNPQTPTPWINYIGGSSYAGFISGTAGGLSWYKDPKFARVLRYRYNGIPMDRPGRYIYVKDVDSGEYFSPSWQPVLKIDQYECRHGLGYTNIKGKYKNVSCSTKYFVPINDDCEIWLTTIKNESDTTKRLRTFSYAEFCFYHAEDDQHNVDWIQQGGKGWITDDILHFSMHFRLWGTTYFASSEKFHSFDISREEFIGKYRSESNPIAVERGQCSNTTISRGNGVGSICHSFELKPGEEKTIAYILGFRPNGEVNTITESVHRWRNLSNVYNAISELSAFWNNYTGKLKVNTPDADIDNFVNVWNQYQCKTTFNWSRFISMYQLGISRGIGFRDGCQDCLGVMHTDPAAALVLLKKLLKNQFKRGNAYHLFYPMTGTGDHGEALKGEGYSDDHLWLIITVSSYIKETGDWAVLDEIVPFADDAEGASIYMHLKQAVAFTDGDRGVKGLPKIRFADWNDSMNIGRGENNNATSVWTAFMFAYVVREFSQIVKTKEGEAASEKYTAMYSSIKNLVSEVAWEDDRFVRAFRSNGEPIGSKKCEKVQIDLIAQVWAILSGVVSIDQGRKLMDVTDSLLNTKYGLMLHTPPYEAYDDEIGGASSYPPSVKENGGIFCHTNPWAMIAETMLRRGDRAYKYYCQIHPAKMENQDTFEIEPYVYAQNIIGKLHPKFGLGRNSWLSGTAAWNLVAISQYILGIRPEYDGLLVDPCIPEEWNSFKVSKVFRGKLIDISVANPTHVQYGVKEVKLNGKKLDGNIIEASLLGDVNVVEVIMG